MLFQLLLRCVFYILEIVLQIMFWCLLHCCAALVPGQQRTAVVDVHSFRRGLAPATSCHRQPRYFKYSKLILDLHIYTLFLSFFLFLYLSCQLSPNKITSIYFYIYIFRLGQKSWWEFYLDDHICATHAYINTLYIYISLIHISPTFSCDFTFSFFTRE